MAERPYSRYTRPKTWAALDRQHLNAGYALVPYSRTNNSIDVISCIDARNKTQDVAKDTQAMIHQLLQHADECRDYYAKRHSSEQAPTILAEAIRTKKLRSAVVLARSSDYYHYHLDDYTGFSLVICGLHDSYLHLPVWEMRTNRRYRPRETAVSLTSPDFERIRSTHFGHSMLLGALLNGDEQAIAFKKTLPPRTQRRIEREKEELQRTRYRGRPLAFLTDAQRSDIGSKISAGLRRYHEHKRLRTT